MACRHEVTDEQWMVVEPLIAVEPAETGRPRRDVREMLNAALWILRTGAPWRDLPERYGPWQSAYEYFNTWRSSGTYDRILEALQIRLVLASGLADTTVLVWSMSKAHTEEGRQK